MKRRKVKAAFTIEAAVIVPIAMVVITALLFFTIYVHDNVIMGTVGTFTIMEEAGKENVDAGDMRREVEDVLSKRMIITKNISVDAQGNEDDFSICISGDYIVPLRVVRKVLGENLNQEKSKINISNLNGRKTLLKYKAIKDGISKLDKGEEEA